MQLQNKILLALDASTEQCSVGLAVGGQHFCDQSATPKTHAKVLLPMVDGLLADRNLSLGDVDLVAVSLGPGSFTGIRICISVAQGLAYGAGIPLVGVSSLEILAKMSIPSACTADAVFVPALDARMNEVYWAAYSTRTGKLKQIHPPCVSAVGSLNNFIQENKAEIIGSGNGWSLKSIETNVRVSRQVGQLPHARGLLSVLEDPQFHSSLVIGERVSDIEPCYLRNEVAWEKRSRIRPRNLL